MANTNKPPDSTPGAAEWGLLNAYLATQGLTPQQRHDCIGQNIDGRSRRQISTQSKDYFKEQADG